METNTAFVPFRVEFDMQGMMAVPDTPIHLDALLSRARVDRDMHEGVEADPPWANQHDLPLAKCETPSGWCFKASHVDITYNSPPIQHHQPRRADVDMWRDAMEAGLFKRLPAFDPARSFTKAVSNMLPMRHASHAVAYGVGDVQAVEALLKLIPSLGKLKRRGAGRIIALRVVACAENECHWHLRNLPTTAALSNFLGEQQYALATGNLIAPYWYRKKTVAVLSPI